MAGSPWTFERSAWLAGLGSAGTMLASAVLRSVPDEGSASDGRLSDFYGSAGNQYRSYIGALLAVLAGMLFLWLLVVLCDRLAAATESRSPALVLAAGVVFVVLWDSLRSWARRFRSA